MFKIQKIDSETLKKLGSKVAIVGAIALFCFFASLIVRFFITARIDDSRKAFSRIDFELPTLMVKIPSLEQKIQNKDGEVFTTNSDLTQNKSVDVHIETTPKTRTLGKQKFVSFDAHNSVSESVTLPEDVVGTRLLLPVFTKSDIKNFKADVSVRGATMPLSADFSVIGGEGYYTTVVPTSWASQIVTIDYSWDVEGSRKISFSEGIYNAVVTTNWDKISIKRSEFGTVTKSENGSIATFTFGDPYGRFEYNNEPSVEYMTSADDITLTDRVTKYAVIVILLTFFIIFVLDLRRKFTVNFFQYILVGASLCLFYLLNISLGEYTGFTTSYVVATLVTMLINGWYIASVFDSKKYGLITATGLFVVYAVIYWLMRVDSINLLAGTIILYVVLLILMGITATINQGNNKSE